MTYDASSWAFILKSKMERLQDLQKAQRLVGGSLDLEIPRLKACIKSLPLQLHASDNLSNKVTCSLL